LDVDNPNIDDKTSTNFFSSFHFADS